VSSRFIQDQLDAVDEMISSSRTDIRAVGTVQAVTTSSFLAQVIMDGTSVAVPAKLFQHTWCEVGDRVALDLYGSDWFVSGVMKVTPFERSWRESSLQTNGSSGSTSSGSYADMPGNPSWTVNKQFDSTKLRHDFACSMYADAIGRSVTLGVQLSGGTTLDVVKGHWANTGGSLPGIRMFIVGWVYQTGIDAGTYTAEARWKQTGGVITTDSDDRWSFSTRELVG
jgi:hypothetical protein